MERLDVVFASHSLDACDTWRNGAPCSQCWRVAFEAAESVSAPLALQQQLLGMNAHIRSDLGMAARKVGVGALAELEADFLVINGVLGSLVDTVQQRSDWVKRVLSMLDRLSRCRGEVLARQALDGEQDRAW